MKPAARRIGVALGALALAAAVGGGAAWAQDAGVAPGRLSTITVEGQASRDVVPDIAVVTVGVVTDRASAQEAATQTGRIAKGLVAEMKANGIADADIETAQATLTPVMDTSRGDDVPPTIKMFRAANVIAVKVRQLDQAGDLAGRLIDKGANDLQGVDYGIANPEPVLDALRADATRDAARRAAIYAKAAGVMLGRVLEIRPDASGAPQPFVRRMKMEAVMAAPATVPLQAGTQTLEARVSITWELAQTP